MTYTIAVSGKGGVGKSTFAALAVRFLAEEIGRTVLAVDGDPNATLGAMLGVQTGSTVADIREETLEKKDNIPADVEDRFVEYRIQQSIVEHPGFDLLTMGRPEGPGCYCFVNSLLRGYLDQATKDYPYVVMDTEAGMEHLSRRTTTGVDLLVIVTEPTVVGADTARRISALIKTLPIAVRRAVVLANRVPPEGLSQAVRLRLDGIGLPLVGEIPADEGIVDAASSGRSLLELPKDNAVYAAVREILARELKLSVNKAIRSA